MMKPSAKRQPELRKFLRGHRERDNCPACQARAVFPALAKREHNGRTFVDCCAVCGVVWERETRSRPCDEPCSNCAWLLGSPEHRSGKIVEIAATCVDGDGKFYCHKRVPGKLTDNGIEFQHRVNDAGSRVVNATPCAGWIRARQQERRAEEACP